MAEPAAKKQCTEEFPLDRPVKEQPFMGLALLLMEPTDHHLQLAAQVGVKEIVLSYPGSSLEAITAVKTRIEQFGMKFTVIERLVPHDKIVHNKPGRDEQIENFKTLLRNMGKAGLTTLCYNWMPAGPLVVVARLRVAVACSFWS
jgi:D-mannonate dehydratase